MTEAKKKSPSKKIPAARPKAAKAPVMKIPAKAKRKTTAKAVPKKTLAKPTDTKPQAPQTSQAPLTSKSTPARNNNGIFKVVATAMVVAVVFAGSLALWPKVTSYLNVKNDPNTPPATATKVAVPTKTIQEMRDERAEFDKQLKAVVERVDTLSQSIKSVVKMVEATTPSKEAEQASAALKQLKTRFAKMEERGADLAKVLQRLDKLEKSNLSAMDGPSPNELATKNDQVSSAVSDIQARVDALEKIKAANNDASAGARAIVLAVGQLRDALQDDSPFTETLQALNAVAEGKNEVTNSVEKLAPFAKTGVASLATLRSRFNAMASAATMAASIPENATWTDKALNRLTSLVSVRQVDGKADENSLDGILYRAETSLNAGNLMDSVKALETLSGSTAKAAATWLKDAKGRIAVERAMASLNVFSVSLLAPKE